MGRFAAPVHFGACVCVLSGCRVSGGLSDDFVSRLSSWYQMDSARFAFLTVGFLLVAYKILHMAYGSTHTALLGVPPALLRRVMAQQHGTSVTASGGGLSSRVQPGSGIELVSAR